MPLVILVAIVIAVIIFAQIVEVIGRPLPKRRYPSKWDRWF